MLKKAKNIYINFDKNWFYDSINTIKIVAKRTDIKNISIIADNFFTTNILEFLGQLKLIIDNNKSISKINYLSLRGNGIHSFEAIHLIGQTIINKNITTLDLSNNKISDEFSPILAQYLMTTKIDNFTIKQYRN
jgi:Ran GTPase-activating protein (RanGAP) involved in mRNA processing and transport